MTLYERLKRYVLNHERAGNNSDGKGDYCTHCGCYQGEAHSSTCEVAALCADIRLLERAKKLETGEDT